MTDGDADLSASGCDHARQARTLDNLRCHHGVITLRYSLFESVFVGQTSKPGNRAVSPSCLASEQGSNTAQHSQSSVSRLALTPHYGDDSRPLVS